MIISIAAALALFAAVSQDVIARLFAATPEGPFITYSWGEQWSRLRGDLRGFHGDIRAFACLGPWVFAGGSDGLFLSEDFGENFRPVDAWPENAPAVTKLLTARLFGLDPTIFVGTSSGLYRSTDSGHKWRPVGEKELHSAVHDMVWPGPELFVATDSGLFRSIDGGESFAGVGKGLPDAPVLSLAGSRFFALDPTIFAGTRGQGLFKSSDGGGRFQPVGAKVLGQATVRALIWWNTLLIVGTEEGLYFSSDAGASFQKVAAFESRSVLSLSVPGEEGDISSDIIVGTDRGVFKSSDGGQSFRSVQAGMGEVAVKALATFPIAPQYRELRPR